ncbi:MAG: hypothetical protein JWN40_3811 [Phycisphaerales bacterium]|nr:hypothetical protein [Phycisphaerales bacterium]
MDTITPGSIVCKASQAGLQSYYESGPEWAVYVAIAAMLDKRPSPDEAVATSPDEIATATGLSVRTVEHAINTLSRDGVIAINGWIWLVPIDCAGTVEAIKRKAIQAAREAYKFN